MKTNLLASVLIAAAFSDLALQAQTFTYTPGDLLAAFRKANSPDLIVDLGSISNYQTPNGLTTTFNLGTDLTTAFGGTSGLYWSVFTFDSAGTYAPANTLFMSSPQGSVPQTGTLGAQINTISKMGGLENAATLSAANGTIIDNQVIELPASLGTDNGGNPASYTTAYGSGLDWTGTYTPAIENISTGSPTSLDLFQLNPAANKPSRGPGLQLGTVTLAGDGTSLAFTAVPEPSTFAMAGSGMIGLMALRRLAKRK